uniref:Translation initiation factor 1 n=1 Tax=Gentiana yunnanensis TaxID=1499142 RepID=A0A8F4XEN1_9GENT|nr:translation initiation factor 1 [Gentiana yunnanensis]
MVIFLIHKMYQKWILLNCKKLNRVKVEVSCYDSTWGRIIFRLRNKNSQILWFEHPLIVE